MNKTDRVWNINLDVVGLGFRLKRETRKSLADLIDKKGEITGIKLVREPDNEYDANAIAVFLPLRLMHGAQLGYLRRNASELLGPRFDRGSIAVKRANLVGFYTDEDNKTGRLYIEFRDVPQKPLTAKGKVPS